MHSPGLTPFAPAQRDSPTIALSINCFARTEVKPHQRRKCGTFEDYCNDRWGMARNYANKMIAAAEVVGNLGTIVPILPAAETVDILRPIGLIPQSESEW